MDAAFKAGPVEAVCLAVDDMDVGVREFAFDVGGEDEQGGGRWEVFAHDEPENSRGFDEDDGGPSHGYPLGSLDIVVC